MDDLLMTTDDLQQYYGLLVRSA